jgi:hypothetical protein
MHAPVLRPAALCIFGADRLFLAQTHRLDLVRLPAKKGEHALHAVGAVLTEPDVVLAAATLVGMSLDKHPGLGVRAQIFRVCFHYRPILIVDCESVVVEVDRAPRGGLSRILSRAFGFGVAPRYVRAWNWLRLDRLRTSLTLCFAALTFDAIGSRCLTRGGGAPAEEQDATRGGA